MLWRRLVCVTLRMSCPSMLMAPLSMEDRKFKCTFLPKVPSKTHTEQSLGSTAASRGSIAALKWVLRSWHHRVCPCNQAPIRGSPKPGRSRSPQPWAWGRLNGDGSRWSVRLQLGPTGWRATTPWRPPEPWGMKPSSPGALSARWRAMVPQPGGHGSASDSTRHGPMMRRRVPLSGVPVTRSCGGP